MVDETTPKRCFKNWIPDEAFEHAREARKEFRKSISALLPPEFREHRRKARKAMLLAWRSVIDAAIERLDKNRSDAS